MCVQGYGYKIYADVDLFLLQAHLQVGLDFQGNFKAFCYAVLNCIAIVIEFGALTVTIALVFVAVNAIVVVFEVTIVDVATLWLSFMSMAQTTMISFAIHCQYADEIS
uniref:Uncharacterized protein n=1 Tax=Glossina pallidipes TaxID=7398 RepID=A0A1A9Z460_GLOPL